MAGTFLQGKTAECLVMGISYSIVPFSTQTFLPAFQASFERVEARTAVVCV